MSEDHPERLTLIAEVAASYLRQNSVGVDQISHVVSTISKALDRAGRELAGETVSATDSAPAAAQKPAVPVRRSVQEDYIVCLEDGLRVRTLKRHLGSAHGMTPKDYRERWNLPRDYPLTAPGYSARRSEMAKKIGLGGKAARAGRKRAGRKRAAQAG